MTASRSPLSALPLCCTKLPGVRESPTVAVASTTWPLLGRGRTDGGTVQWGNRGQASDIESSTRDKNHEVRLADSRREKQNSQILTNSTFPHALPPVVKISPSNPLIRPPIFGLPP